MLRLPPRPPVATAASSAPRPIKLTFEIKSAEELEDLRAIYDAIRSVAKPEPPCPR